MYRWIKVWALAGALTTGVIGWTGTALADASDAWITTKVKLALMASNEVDGSNINVDSYDGRVTLQGRVSSGAERNEAERLSMQVSGVKGVRNLLDVSRPRVRYGSVSDRRVRDEVNRALHYDPRLQDSEVSVRTVGRGVVTLTGRASSTSDELRAIQIASRTPGTRRVVSEIRTTEDRLADDEWDDRAGSSHRYSDFWITNQIKLRYMADPDVPASDVSVDTRAGRVTLFGMVPTAEAREEAERIAQSVSGVRSVNDELRVVPVSRQSAIERSDREIEAAVRKRLANANLEGADIDVDVSAGIVRLTGAVRTNPDRYRAVAIVRATRGVRAVRQDLRIQGLRASL